MCAPIVILQVSVGKVGVFVGVFSIPCVYQVGGNEVVILLEKWECL